MLIHRNKGQQFIYGGTALRAYAPPEIIRYRDKGMRIVIDNIAYGGYGVGRVDGKAVFVDYALPGDELEIEIYDDRKSFSFASYKEIIRPSDKRVASPCPNFGICGGCSYLNLSYSDEIDFKKIILKDQLKRIALIETTPEINVITGGRFHYRSHSSVKCRNDIFGFYGKNSNDIIPFPDSGCMLISQNLIDGINNPEIGNLKGEMKIAEDWMGNFFYDGDKPLMIEEKTGDYYYKRDINSFFQSNKYLRGQMAELVCSYSELSDNDEFADICAGCGFFTIPLSRMALSGTGYDIDKNSIKSAQINASRNKCTNLKFFPLAESEINPARLNPKTVVIDPPRAGISKKGRRTINAINPEIIVYVSCNPSTFSRDITDFFKNGYRLSDITLIDMFPCTHHIEVISRLVKVHR
jgi:23S rRNA (uracil1939-C5)-methyltransferase